MKKALATYSKSTTTSSIDTSKDIFEALLDQTLSDSLLKEIPVIGSVVGLARTGKAIKDYLFAKKLHTFLVSLETITNEEQKKYNDHLGEDPVFKEKVGIQLLMFMEQADTIEKAVLLANAFSALLKSLIDYKDFLDLGSLINTLKHSMLEDMCLVLYHASSVSYQREINSIRGKSMLEAIGFLRRDGLLVFEIESIPRYRDESMLTGRDQDKKTLKIVTISKYKATRLAVLFVNYVVSDIYTSVASTINSDSYFFTVEGTKPLDA